ncbi:MAG: YbaK/EbsC family protein [Anaerovoracaceae bacterium]
MDLYKKVEEKLNEQNIPFEIVEHEPALTTEQADSFIEGIEGVRTKTMFLTNKKKTEFYLLIMDDKKRLDMDKFKEIVSSKQIKMASENSLFEKMMLPPGVVSPFGLLNNEDEGRMCFHPNTNEKTLFLKTVDLLKYLESIEYKANIIEI